MGLINNFLFAGGFYEKQIKMRRKTWDQVSWNEWRKSLSNRKSFNGMETAWKMTPEKSLYVSFSTYFQDYQ